jgi:hypothetical protein
MPDELEVRFCRRLVHSTALVFPERASRRAAVQTGFIAKTRWPSTRKANLLDHQRTRMNTNQAGIWIAVAERERRHRSFPYVSLLCLLLCRMIRFGFHGFALAHRFKATLIC